MKSRVFDDVRHNRIDFRWRRLDAASFLVQRSLAVNRDKRESQLTERRRRERPRPQSARIQLLCDLRGQPRPEGTIGHRHRMCRNDSSEFGKNGPRPELGIKFLVGGNRKRCRVVNNRITECNDLIAARNCGCRFSNRHRTGIDQNDDVESLILRNRPNGIGRDTPHRCENVRQRRRDCHEIRRSRWPHRQRDFDSRGFIGKIHHRDSPRLGEGMGEFLRITRHVRLVDKSEILL